MNINNLHLALALFILTIVSSFVSGVLRADWQLLVSYGPIIYWFFVGQVFNVITGIIAHSLCKRMNKNATKL